MFVYEFLSCFLWTRFRTLTSQPCGVEPQRSKYHFPFRRNQWEWANESLPNRSTSGTCASVAPAGTVQGKSFETRASSPVLK
jgi:hypothetical protein